MAMKLAVCSLVAKNRRPLGRKVVGVVFRRKQSVHQSLALVGFTIGKKGFRFLWRGQSTRDINRYPAEEGGVVTDGRRGKAQLAEVRKHFFINKVLGEALGCGDEIWWCVEWSGAAEHAHLTLVPDHHRHRPATSRPIPWIGRRHQSIHSNLGKIWRVDLVLGHPRHILNPAIIEERHHPQLLPLSCMERAFGGKHFDLRHAWWFSATRPSAFADPFGKELIRG